MRAAVLTVSTSRAAGPGEDQSGPALARFAESMGAEVVAREIVRDDADAIAAALRGFAQDGCDLVLTTGGTGVAPSDVTPEATRAVAEREVAGIGEAMRAASREHTPHWMLSRATAGVHGRTLIVNFPGSPRSIGQVGDALREALPHAVALLGGSASHDDAAS